MQHNSALATQAQHYKAVRDRLFKGSTLKRAPAQKPQLLALRDYDEHVRAWHKRKAFSETLNKTLAFNSFSTSGHLEMTLTSGAYEVNLDIGGDPNPNIKKRSMIDICKAVLKNFPGVTLDEIRGAHRFRHVVEARQACMYEIYKERKDVSFPMLGHFFGGRDHSTALHAVKRVAAQRGDPDAAKWVTRKHQQVTASHERSKAREQA